ncbi:brother of CDO isoform X3 [Pseudoliparis swirei]|uniref:brother of CDO isoform X3 n=1 Tax=Pseudoliparis swirei TaxID=2059687 RepID=UPI0024BD78ED|nr:brother of CDO isoform X3 [Pseudoliparis swirei]
MCFWGSVWKMSGKRDWTPWMKKRRAPVLCALGAVLLCCLQSGAALPDEAPLFSEEPVSVVQKLGGSVNLRCRAQPASANISWRLNGQELVDEHVELGPSGLFIPALSNLTVGRYQCVASTSAGALASVPANVTAAKLRDFESDDQHEIEVDEGNTAIIECHLPESQPKAQVRYSVKQEWLETSKGNYLIMPSGNLQIANATQEDEGTYKCAAYNPITQEIKTSSSTDRLRIRRSTSEAARIIYPPSSRSIMVTKGQRLVLECVASGIPTPHVIWAKDGQDLGSHNKTRFLLSNLLIDVVGEADSGTYICRADNGISSASSATVLYDVQVFEPPRVTVELQQQEVVYGETVRFTCQARGKPTPSVMWLHNARPLAPSPRHRLSSRALRVSNVGPQDDGLYQCMAENGVGSSQASARLITVSTGISSRVKLPSIYRPLSPDQVLREQPPVMPGAAGAMLPLDCSEMPGQILPAEAPIILSLPRTGKADYYELTWRPRHERGVPVLEYMVKFRKVGVSLADWTSSSISGALHKLTLAKLQPDSLYEVEMAAKNCAGLGQPAMMTFRTGKSRRGLGQIDPPKTPAVPSPSLSPPEAPDKPTVSTATETSAYVTWIPRGNRGFPIQSFRVEYKKVKKAGEDWVTAVENIPPSRLSVEITGLEKGTSYKFRVVAVNVIGSSPPSAPSKAYTVVGGRTHERPVDGPYITYNEAINETTVILKWTYTPVNNTPIYGFYIYYRPTDSDNDSDYKKDVVEGDRYWHSITDLQPETAYDIKMQSFNEKGESEFGNVVILETKDFQLFISSARPNQQRPVPSETPDHRLGQPSGLVPRPGDLPYLIVGIVLGAFVFIIVAFIPFCLWRAWAKQKQMADLCFPAVVAPVSSCQYTMVPLQGLTLVGHCPLDARMTAPHGVYPVNGEYGEYPLNGKPHHHTHRLPGLQQEEVDCDMECDTLLPHTMSNGHLPVYHYSRSPDHHEQSCCPPDDSTLQLLDSSHQHHGSQELGGDDLCIGDKAEDGFIYKPASFPRLSLEDEGIFTTSSSAATTPQSQDVTIQEVNILPNVAYPEDEGTANTTDA